MTDPSLGNRTIVATVWSGVGIYGQRLITLGVGMVLSRTLSAGDFGLIALIGFAGGFFSVLSDCGISNAVVQFRDFERRELGSLLIFSMLLSVGITAMMWLSAPLIAAFFKNNALIPVCRVLSIGLFFTAVSAVPTGLLKRDMRFKELAKYQMFATSMGAVVCLYGVYLGLSYWAVVAQVLVTSILGSVVVFWLARLPPFGSFGIEAVKRVFSFSGYLLIGDIVRYIGRNAEVIVIGRALGEGPLGQYNRAYSLFMLPVSLMASALNPVLHSSLSSIQDDRDRMRTAYLQIVRLIATISMPVMAVSVVLGPELVRLCWGPNWSESIPIFQVLGVAAMVQPLIAPSGAVFMAQSKTKWFFRMALCNNTLILITITIGVQFGLIGVAWGYTTGAVVTFSIVLYITLGKLLGTSMAEFISTVRFPLMLAAVLTAFAVVVAWGARIYFDYVMVLVLVVVPVSVIYLLSVATWQRSLLEKLAKSLPSVPQSVLLTWLNRLSFAHGK
ncbi:MAG: lipopolysaccharide biosynthesis protein [Verrucomicrobiae bacterium]|nr:lipopolysaccharide biosynthesis protein [Verrucomicrobiae bacterium]